MQKKNSKKPKLKSPFRSFRRAYHDEYADNFEAPGLLSHAGRTFNIIFKNWKFFGELLLIILFSTIFLVGLLNQDSIKNIQSTIDSSSEEIVGSNLGDFAKAGLLLISTVTTGGLNQDLSEGQGIILVLVFLLIWLATIYFLRRHLASKKATLRECLYNSFSPLISTFVIFAIILIEAIPIFITIIFYNAALKTEFLTTPFYALLFIAFAGVMLLLSGYLISSSTIALVAVSSPGLYPLPALRSTHELMFGRRIKFIIRLIFLIFIVATISVIIMLPIILLDNLLKTSFDFFDNIPFISFWLLAVTIFNFIYISAYIYLYYRKMLEYESK